MRLCNDFQPITFAPSQNFPNPFNPKTKIEYTIPARAHVKITIFNILGQKVKRLVDSDKLAGSYTVIWDGRDDVGRIVSTGIYEYRLQAADYVETRKMLLLK